MLSERERIPASASIPYSEAKRYSIGADSFAICSIAVLYQE